MSWGSLLGNAAATDLLDCEKIKSTKIPFEIVIEGGLLQEDGTDKPSNETQEPERKIQVFRQEDGYTIVYQKLGNSDLIEKIVYHHGFGIKHEAFNPGKIVDITTAPSPEPVSDIFGARRNINLSFKQVSRWKGKPDQNVESKIDYTYLKDDAVVIGPCRFKVTMYDTRISAPGSEVVSTSRLSYSPDLTTMLVMESRIDFGTGGKVRLVKRTARSIRTTFTPLLDQ